MRFIVRILVLLFFLMLLLAIFAPSILSTQFGKSALFRTVKSMSGYEIHSETLKLRWMKNQAAAKVEVFDQSGKSVFRADSITSSAPLWKILFYHDVGHLEVKDPFVVIEPPQKLASRLATLQAGFIFSVTLAPTKKAMKVLGDISVSGGSAQFVTPGLPPISVNDIQLQATLLPKQIKVQSSGTTQEGSLQGTFDIDLLAYPGSSQIDAVVKVANFPLRAADQLVSILYPGLKGVLRETIGESFNADIKLKNLQDNLEVFVKANSDFFSASLETTVVGDTLQLSAPATFQFQIPKASFEKLTSLSIQNNVSAQIKIDELSIPLQSRQQLSLQGTLKSDALQFNEWTLEPFTLYLGTAAASAGEWSIKIDSPQIQFHGALNLPEKWENLSFTGEALLPRNTKLELSAESLKSIAVNLQGDLWKGRFKGAFDPIKKTASLQEPGFISVQLDKLPPIEVNIDPTTIHIDTLSGSVKGIAKASPFELGAAKVGDTSVQFSADLKTKLVQFDASSSVDQGPLSASGTLGYPSDLKMTGSCTNFPVASLQPFLTKGPPLQPLIGESLTTNFQVSHSSTASLLYINTSSSNLTLKASLKGNEKSLELIEPASFVWTLTPEGYVALAKWLQGSAPYTLSKPAVFKGSVSTLMLPELRYETKITCDEVAFETNKVTQLLANLSHKETSSPHLFQISAKAAPQGTLLCKGSWIPPGTADVQLLLEQFPAATFDFFSAPFSGNKYSLVTLCGPNLNLSLRTTLTDWNGQIKFEITSANLRSSLNGSMKQGTLLLSDPFHLQLNITPQLSQMFMKSGDITSIRSEGPITLVVKPQGFSYPVAPYDLSKIQVGSARLELGKLLCRNSGNVQITLGLLKQGQYRAGDELELWLAPMDFSIQNGILSAERTEILIAKEYQVCTWGDLDLPDNSVNATLGLTASCLSRAFGIKNLPEKYVLQIPVRGTLTDVKIDKGKATTKIGALMIWQQKGAVGGMVKGPAGKFLSEGLNKLGPLPGGDQKAPPAKKPFPWDSEASTSKKKTSETSHKKRIAPEDSALKQALKLIR
jgi:hypothetical protein